MAKSRRPKRVLIGVVVVVLGLLAVPGYFFVRLRLLAPTYEGVTSIETASAYQDDALLERAWSLPVARTFGHRVVYQSNGSTCGPTSLANALRSLGDASATEDSVLEGTGTCWTGVCLGGLTLEELAEVARAAAPDRRITILRDLTTEQLREHLTRSNDPSVRYIANFTRGPLFGRGGGHHSPIAGYLEDLDLVFVLDVNEVYRPWLVSTDRLFQAIDSADSSSGRTRGLLRIE